MTKNCEKMFDIHFLNYCCSYVRTVEKEGTPLPLPPLLLKKEGEHKMSALCKMTVHLCLQWIVTCSSSLFHYVVNNYYLLGWFSDANSSANLAQAGVRTSFGITGLYFCWPGSQEGCCGVYWKNEVTVDLKLKITINMHLIPKFFC